jgi:hypothetical protein
MRDHAKRGAPLTEIQLPVSDLPGRCIRLDSTSRLSYRRTRAHRSECQRGAAPLNATGPLFAGPSAAHGIPWLAVLPILIAIPAAALLLWGLIRGTLPATVGTAAVLLPIAAYGFASLYMLEDSKQVSFCGSCHVMEPIVSSVESNDGSLASTHFARGLIRHDQACYVCHSGYGIWGTMDAKTAGLMHMVRTATGRYALPLRLNGPFDIDSCLNCHAFARSFRAVEAHQDPDLQEQLVSRALSCTGTCHPAAHPAAALDGQMPQS